MKTIAMIIATGFGSGYMPKAPGTAGAFVALIISLLLLHFSLDLQLIHGVLIVLFTILGVWASNVMESEWGHDPGKIVVDEMVGIWVTFMFVAPNVIHFILGFILFRIFDIAKPFGIRKVEKLPRGWGVMMDDVVAGIFANVVLQILIWGHSFCQL